MKKTLLIFLSILTQLFYAQSDCTSALAVCGNNNISYTPSGFGAIQEQPLGGGCLSIEHFSVWYTFTASTSGTLTFLITPNAQADYDWAVFGPNKPCGSLGAPIRCSYASTASGILTGLNMTSTDLSEGAGGDGFVKYLDVIAGETYYLIVDNFSANANGFVLSWGGTATLSSPFTTAIQPNPFIPPGSPNVNNPGGPNEVIICTDPATFDFSSLSAGIINGNPNFQVTYHTSSNDALTGNNPITTPQVVSTTATYYYSISYVDTANPNSAISKCKQTGTFKFKQGNIVATDDTLTECNNNNTGTAIFDLTSANVLPDPTAIKKYYPTMVDLNAGTNEITNPANFVSSTGVIYVKVTTLQGCSDVAQINLNFYPVVVVTEATLRSCFIESNPSTALFNLTTAAVTTQTGTKTYYPSVTDAVNGTNEILNPTQYISPNGVVYIKVTNANGCYGVAKVNLIVLPPVYSNVLEDKIICMEDTTTLDAGPGFTGYAWSTGATTQTINNVTVGTYWVDLKTGTCVTRQQVKVYPSEQPVISNIDIANNTLTISVVGGTAPYKYSLDNINWQDSNVFTNVPRGDNTVYVKDDYDCEPQTVTVVVPNLVNVITPNGDGVNDIIDYSALSSKSNLVLNIYDRYGVLVGKADKFSGFKWDGTTAGKKVPTGTYWYSVTWNENNKKSTPIKFSGWVMVKNRE
ncbi:T9SS type B sorting domain-containing protein [Chryseobacterium sp. MMS23-Vi53]|uniref:T9SS type B sorting domain-containing protein n=1 Tax=Chryseobacterium sp. MMS23-Vi53 TaxID=3386644 RepID=UPI0039ED4A4E